MASETENFGLIKPSEDEFYDINIFNENANIIDTQLQANRTNIENLSREISVEIQEVNIKIGETTDDSTKSTIFGGLGKLHSYLSATIKPILDTIKGYTDTIETTQNNHTTTLSTINTNVNTIKSNTTNTSAIKSVQRGLYLKQSGPTTWDIPISSVNVNKSTIKLNGFKTQGNSWYQMPYLYLASATKIEGASYGNGGEMVISWEVIEYV